MRPFRRWRSVSRALLPIAAAMLAGVACSNDLEPSENQLTDARRRWDAAGVRSYSMVMTRSGFVGGPVSVKVTVAQGTVTDRRFVADDQPVPAAEAGKYPDVEGLFALAQDAFDRAEAISATFDATYGFPTALIIDYVQSKLDDDLTIVVGQFTPAT